MFLILKFAETLRKHPSVPILVRECTKDYKIPDTEVFVKKGEILLIPITAIQNDPEFFPNPERFDPDRFSPTEKAGRDNFLHLAFGGGPRICIGKLISRIIFFKHKFQFRHAFRTAASQTRTCDDSFKVQVRSSGNDTNTVGAGS